MHFQGCRMKRFFSRRLRQFAKWYKTKLRHKAIILAYHRVKETETDPQLLAVTPLRFEQHLDILRSDYQPISLEDLCKALKKRQIPARAVAVTFDDGYSDNLYMAKPLLERYGIPATVFVTSGFIGRTRAFWWDELEGIFLRPGRLPQDLELTLGRSSFQWDLREVAVYSEAKFMELRNWSVLEQSDPTPRHGAYRTLCRAIRTLSETEQEKLLAHLRGWAGRKCDAKENRVLTPEEVLALTNNGLVDAGSHTMSHSVLSALSPTSQSSEIRDSKAALEEVLGRPVTAFAYPFGSRDDYTEQTAHIVHQCGFSCACSNYRDVVWRYSDSFQLPRFIVRDWEGERFARQLSEWFDG